MATRNPNNERSKQQMAGTAGGMTRKSLSRAKPTRQAAESVRVAPSAKGGRKGAAPKPLSKEEKKEQRRMERDARDRQVVVSNILLKQNEQYTLMRRIWWVLLATGLVLTAVAWLAMFVFPGASSDLSEPMGIVSVVALVCAYIAIIGAFIFDWVKVRPIRKVTDAQVAGMTEKRMQQLIDKDYEAEQLARAAKEEAKSKGRDKDKGEDKGK